MAKYEIILMGDRDGNGAIVKKTGFFGASTWTANNDSSFEKWVCLETGKYEFKGVYCDIDFFYKAQYDTLWSNAASLPMKVNITLFDE